MLSFISDMIAYVFRLHDCLARAALVEIPDCREAFLTEGDACGSVTQPTPFRHRTRVIWRMG